jgi:hypothetical protein
MREQIYLLSAAPCHSHLIGSQADSPRQDTTGGQSRQLTSAHVPVSKLSKRMGKYARHLHHLPPGPVSTHRRDSNSPSQARPCPHAISGRAGNAATSNIRVRRRHSVQVVMNRPWGYN